MSLVILNEIFSAEVPTITMSSSAANMSERGDNWLSRGFSVTCIVSAFIGALMVAMLLGEPDVLMETINDTYTGELPSNSGNSRVVARVVLERSPITTPRLA